MRSKMYFIKSPQKIAEKHLFFPREFPRDLDMSTKIRYELESKTNQKGESLIHLILSYGFKEYNPKTRKDKYQSLKISTQQSIRKEDWNGDAPKKKYIASKGKTLQTRIANLAQECEHQLDLYINEHNETPHPRILKRLIEEKIGRVVKTSADIRIVDHIDSIIESNSMLPLTANGKLEGKTVGKYKTVKDILLAYEAYNNLVITNANLNKEMYFDIWHFANEQYKSKTGKKNGYLINTVSKNSGTLISALRKGKFNQSNLALNLDDPQLNIKEVKSRDAEVFLSERDLDKVLNANTLRSKEFINARNYLIICSFTSLRFEDMEALNELQIESFDENGVMFKGFFTKIRKGRKETEDLEVCIPVLNPVADILSENGGRFPSFPANQTMNRQLKKFAEHIGLNKKEKVENWYYGMTEAVIDYKPIYSMLKCHLGRGTFVSNLLNLRIEESDFDYITHPERKLKTTSKYYDKRGSIQKAARLVKVLRSASRASLYHLD